MYPIKTCLTFDDVLIKPAFSEIHPSKVSIKSKIHDIKLNIPFISAAMDTVSEYSLAIALAREGGLTILHRNMSIDEQANQVQMVKRSESGTIIDPITLQPSETIKTALSIIEKLKIGGIPIIDKDHKLLGIVTNRDLRWTENKNAKVYEVMTPMPLITTSKGITLEKAKHILQKHKIEKLPIVDEKNHLMGLITSKDIEKNINFPNACKDAMGRLRVGAAVGITPDVLDRVAALVEKNVDIIVMDSAHGHSKAILDTIASIKKKYENITLCGGNIATKEGAKALYDVGTDIIKVGIGPGSICTTRIVTGVGIPQLSAIMDVYEYANSKNLSVIADGGIKQTGDIAKALVAGADAVMLGSMFAGVEESPGETIILESRKYKTYRGMGSIDVMKQGSKDRYFQEDKSPQKLVPEGIEGRIPYKGNIAEVIYQMVGGLRAAMGYTGSATLKNLRDCSFVKITSSSLKESHPHTVTITKEAPNYYTNY